MQTVVHSYHFDISKPEQAQAWDALKGKLSAWPQRMKSLTNGKTYYETGRSLDGQTITLEANHLFDNQWNSAPIAGISETGLRVFDWAQDVFFTHCGQENRTIKQGYYLEQTAEMREIRRNTSACGYCGKQEPLIHWRAKP